jgi:HEAT repeat protein
MMSTFALLAVLGNAALAGDDKALEEALDRFKKAYANPSAAARAAAVSELGKTQHEKIVSRLAGFLTSDAPPVRRAAALGLGDFKDYKRLAAPMLMSAIAPNQKEVDVVEAIFQGLGKLDDETTLPTIHRYFEDKNAKIASAALLAAGEIRHVSSVEPILALMKDYEKIEERSKNGGGGGVGVGVPGGGDDPRTKLAKDVLPSTLKAMQAIAKEKYTTTKEWSIWWNKYKATFKTE